jgi:hypothetical protein
MFAAVLNQAFFTKRFANHAKVLVCSGELVALYSLLGLFAGFVKV